MTYCIRLHVAYDYDHEETYVVGPYGSREAAADALRSAGWSCTNETDDDLMFHPPAGFVATPPTASEPPSWYAWVDKVFSELPAVSSELET